MPYCEGDFNQILSTPNQTPNHLIKNPSYVVYKGYSVAGTGLEPVTFGL